MAHQFQISRIHDNHNRSRVVDFLTARLQPGAQLPVTSEEKA